ncbi:MAG: hypothetical protein ACKO6Q_03330 [Bacteroidota bacterium]
MIRKLFFFIALLISGSNSQAQLSLNEMFAVNKMDLDQFESFALRKGYSFNKIVEDENRYGLLFDKGVGVNTKFIKLYTRFYSHGKAVNMQTYNTPEYLTFKGQLNAKAFKHISSDDFEGSLAKKYAKGNWEILIYSGKDDDGDTYYEIQLQNKE